MAKAKNNQMPWFAKMWRPPTTEKKPFTPTSEVWILLMQGLMLFVLLAAGSALAFAALLAWGVSETEVWLLGGGGGFCILLFWMHDRLVDTEVGKAIAILLGSTIGYGLAVYALGSLVAQQPEGLGVQVVQILTLFVGACFVLVLSTAMIMAGHYKAAAWFTLVTAGVTGLCWVGIPIWAGSAAWPWALSGLAVCYNYAAYWTQDAYREEIDDPQLRGMSGIERAILKAVGSQWLEKDEEEPDEYRQPIMVDARGAELLSQEERDRMQWREFVLLAARDSTVRRLKNWGFSYEREIVPWRDLLIEAGLAQQYADGTWELTHEPERVLEVFEFPEAE